MTHISEIPAGTLVKQAHAGVKLIAEQYPEAAAILREAITRLDVLREVHQLAKQEAQPVIPEGLIKAINRLLDNDGSRGCFDALEQHRAKTELELLLTTAQPVSEPYKLAKPPEACAWISDGEGLWLGDCGVTWQFFDDGPNENGLKYCPSCGKKVSVIAAPAQESE